MTKAQFIDQLYQNCEWELPKKTVEAVAEEVFDHVSRAVMKEGRFTFPGFGTFEVRTRKARKGRNPRTGEEIKIKASKTVAFKPSSALKGQL